MKSNEVAQGITHVFLLVPDFSMIAFASAIEPLRLANRISGEQKFAWQLVSEDGAIVQCSNGTNIGVDGGLDAVPRGASIIVVAGLNAHEAASKTVLGFLRKHSRTGSAIGSLCTGSLILARAGLLDGRRCTIHWENQAAFAEEFLDIEVTNKLYEIDGDRFTCAGGFAAADMMLAMIAKDNPPELISSIADQIIFTPSSGARDEQRLSIPARIGVRNPKLVTIIQLMEDNLEDPISPSILATHAKISTRQLERLFRRYLNRSPKRYYMELRLQKARSLLLQTDMSVINVALACGFTSPSHFSKCYRTFFERTPYRERGAPAANANTPDALDVGS